MLAGKLLQVAGAAPLPTFVSSSINRSSTSTNTVTAPTGIQNGDLLVAVGLNAGTAGVTPPTGFSVLSEEDLGSSAYFVATKVASGESGNYSFTYTANSTIAILVYRNATRANTIGTPAVVTVGTSVTASAITPSYSGTLLGVFYNVTSGATITSEPSGFTSRASQTAAVPSLYVYDKSPQSATSTGSVAATWSSNSGNNATSFLLQITNEPDVEPDFVAMAQTTNAISGTSLVINKPTGTVEGDLMIAMMAADGATTWTGDTDWNEVADQSAQPGLRVAYKVAGASEGSSYTFTLGTGGRNGGAILTYRYAAYDTIAGSFTTGANPLVLTSISPTASQSILLAIGARVAASITLGTPTSMTARATDSDATGPSYIVCDQSVAAGPTGTRSMSTGSTNGVAGIMLSIKPTRAL